MQLQTNTVTQGDCLELISQLPDGSIDAIITDPPYPFVRRAYGFWNEQQWLDLMQPLVRECRRVLKPDGSAVFVVQPNAERIGSMRTWLWKFLVWCGEEWNIVQDVYWWNYTAVPTSFCHQRFGLMRPSIKSCIWLGGPDCYRNQDEVLITPSEATKYLQFGARIKAVRETSASGHSRNEASFVKTAFARGGSTPFNLLPVANSNSVSSAGAYGHGAGTPLELARWWVKYLTRPGETILDPFAGTATIGQAALEEGRKYVGFEKEAAYVEMSCTRLTKVLSSKLN